MTAARPLSQALIAGTLALTVLPTASTTEALAYDMDCKTILCLAGGFPPGCADAYAYMISRITRFPDPLPPFGFCAMSDGSEYTGHRTSHSFVSQRSPSGWDCPEDGTHLYHAYDRDDDGGRDLEVFCYTHTTQRRVRDDDGWQTVTIYHGRTPAQAVNFEIQITLEPGTAAEYVSPLFRINTRTGYVAQR